MPCPHCVSADKLFDVGTAQRELRRLEKRGPAASTKKLIDALPRGSLLDVGGGVGAIQQVYGDAGMAITHVDASQAYVAVAREELDRRGVAEHQHLFGDFVDLADQIGEHEVVTLDRVLCCYPDLDALVVATTARASVAWGAVFPKDRWWSRLGVRFVNLGMWLRGSEYRAYVHSEARILALATAAGFELTSQQRTAMWNVWAFGASGRVH